MHPQQPNMPYSGQAQAQDQAQAQAQVQAQAQAQAQAQGQRPRMQYRRYRYTINGQTRITPLMAFHGRCQAQRFFPDELPSRSASGSAQSPPPPYGTAVAQSPGQQQSAAKHDDGFRFPADHSYLFITKDQLWCYCPEPQHHSYFIGKDPVQVGDDEERSLFCQASGAAAAQGMYVADDGTIIVQPCPRPASMPVGNDIWRCNRWADGMCKSDGWTLHPEMPCPGCATEEGVHNPNMGPGGAYSGNEEAQSGQ